jgi:hypothetical protein
MGIPQGQHSGDDDLGIILRISYVIALRHKLTHAQARRFVRMVADLLSRAEANEPGYIAKLVDGLQGGPREYRRQFQLIIEAQLEEFGRFKRHFLAGLPEDWDPADTSMLTPDEDAILDEQLAAYRAALDSSNIPPRDIAIFKARMIDKRTCEDVGGQFGIDKRRVSEACLRVLGAIIDTLRRFRDE